MIINTVTNEYEFWEWLQSSGYKDNFSLEGAKTLQQYLSDYSEDIGQAIEFDPIAWCSNWSEYTNISEAYKEYYGDDSDLPRGQRCTTKAQKLEYFKNNTIVIEVDNNCVIIQDF